MGESDCWSSSRIQGLSSTTITMIAGFITRPRFLRKISCGPQLLPAADSAPILAAFQPTSAKDGRKRGPIAACPAADSAPILAAFQPTSAKDGRKRGPIAACPAADSAPILAAFQPTSAKDGRKRG